MAWCPFAERQPVTMRPAQVAMKPVGLVAHTAVSNQTMVKPATTALVRWHFYINQAGKLYQFFDTERVAAAQLSGNYWDGKGFVSAESWDGAGTSVWPDWRTNPNGGPVWNDAQMATWARLGAWLHTTHGIPLVKATGVHGTGIGYHCQFTAKSGLRWNETHACPGAKRIAQMDDMIHAMQEVAAPASVTDKEPAVPRTLTDADIDVLTKAFFETKRPSLRNLNHPDPQSWWTLDAIMQNNEADIDKIVTLLRDLAKRLDAIEKKLAA